MSRTQTYKLRFTDMEYIKANRKGSREAEIENETGFKSVHKVHRTPKNYSRKIKHKQKYYER